jgi:predicted ferric reductase
MMKIKNTLCLHILMATLAILFLCVHPLVTSFDPPLTFQPLIKSMAGTPKEQAEKIATISHALEGNAIFFIGASEWPPQKMNITLYIITLISNCTNPSWRMAMRLSMMKRNFYCSHVLKIALTQTVKLFCFWHLTAFTQKAATRYLCR